MSSSTDVAPTTADAPPRYVRRFVAALLILLCVPAVIGFDAWPLTGWRLFSLARDNSQIRWVAEAATPAGDVVTVDFEQLPIAYRHAEWPLAELDRADPERRDAVCQALLDGIREHVLDAVGVTIVRDHQHLVERGGAWVVTHDREPFHSCGRTVSR